MRYDLPHFRIDRKDFLEGGNSFNEYPDGSVLTDYYGYNAFKTPGWLTGAPTTGSTVTSSLVTDPGISFGVGKGVLAQEIISVGTNSAGDGYYYKISESTGAFQLVGSADTTQTYQQGFTDTIFYHGSFYTTSKSDIVKNSYDLATRDVSFWQTTSGHGAFNTYAFHPQVVYGDIHYIADGRYIHQNDNGTTQINVLDLGSDWVITAMCVYNNLIHIAAEPYYNFSGNSHGGSKIFTWNGYADSWLDEYETDLRITAMYVWRSVMYVWTHSSYMGYFTGSTVKPLYPISNPVYKSQITTTRDSMWFADGTAIVRYGSPQLKSDPRFHRYWNMSSSVNGIIGSYNNGLLIVVNGASNGQNRFVSDVNNNDIGEFIVALNPRTFSQPVKIRGYVVNSSQMGPTKQIKIGYIDESNTITGLKIMSNTTAPGLAVYRANVYGEKAVTRIYPYLDISGIVNLKSVDYLFELNESEINK